jgi:transcriptional regulator with XRE-family HTH domain
MKNLERGSGCMSQNQRIKELRKHLGLTQTEFGSKVGIVQGHQTGIESGKRNVTRKTLKVICATYGASEEWIETGSGEMFAQSYDKKANRMIGIFNELSPEFQDYLLLQIKSLLMLQKNTALEK